MKENIASFLDSNLFGSQLTVRDALIGVGIGLCTGAITYGVIRVAESFTRTDVNLIDRVGQSIL